MNFVNVLVWATSCLFLASLIMPFFLRWEYRTHRFTALGLLVTNVIFLFAISALTYYTFWGNSEPMSAWWLIVAAFTSYFGIARLFANKMEMDSIKRLKQNVAIEQANRDASRR